MLVVVIMVEAVTVLVHGITQRLTIAAGATTTAGHHGAIRHSFKPSATMMMSAAVGTPESPK